MLTLPGAPALSAFRLSKLLNDIQTLEPSVTAVRASYLHLAETDGELSQRDSEVLHRLLTYGPRAEKSAEQGQMVLVVPRFGTISPWSSKATDIAHICGLQALVRIERGIAYNLESKTPMEAAQMQEVEARAA